MAERICVIVNPASGRGRGVRALPAVRAAFGAVGVTDVRQSASLEDEGTLARRALDEGCTTLVAVGGDGTWSNVANAILHARADCRLALVAAGTGNDFAKTVGAPARDVARTARLAVEGPDRPVDVGRIEDRHFVNIAGFGFDIAVLEDIGRIRWLHGDALYLYSALRQLAGYGGIEIDVESAAARRGRVRHLLLIIANARNFGGAFRIAPGASLTDGRLDAVAIRDASPLRRLRLFGAVIRGTHTTLPDVLVEQAAAFTLRFPSPPAYETDGEYRRAASAELTIACLPRALRVVVSEEAVERA
ncbi:MAG TPA: diacylglycerol kinase family protein [Gemmatimonadaceae bacterium]|nr:diacylglycerol kinase family protein [Gemmatimonadaceae bacterium]